MWPDTHGGLALSALAQARQAVLGRRCGDDPGRPSVEAEEREDRTWVVVWLPSRPDFHPEPMLDAVSTPISEVNGLEQQSQSGATQIEAAIRSWWARQQR